MGNFIQELKRRKVVQVSSVYAVVAWLLIQVADTLMPALQMPHWTVSFVTVLLLLGFPVALILSWAYQVTPEGVRPDPGTVPSTNSSDLRAHTLNYAILILVLAFGLLQLFDPFDRAGPAPTRPDDTSTTTRMSLLLDQPWNVIIDERNFRTDLNISSDGSQLIYASLDQFENGQDALILKDLTTGNESQLLVGDGFTATFGRNDKFLAVLSPRDVTIISTAGSQQTPIKLEARGNGLYKGDWIDQNRFVYTDSNGKLRVIDLETGAMSSIPGLDDTLSELGQFTPHVLPDSRFMLFASAAVDLDGEINIRIHDFESQRTRELILDGYAPTYVSSGHIIFARGDSLWAAPFDLDSGQLTGSEVRVIEGVHNSRTIIHSVYTVSDKGRLVYLHSGDSGPRLTLYRVDRQGNERPLELPASMASHPEISQDGRFLALTLQETRLAGDVWIYDLVTGNPRRLTYSEAAIRPKWSPDGLSLVFESLNENSIFRINTDGSGGPQAIIDMRTNSGRITPETFTLNGDELLYLEGNIGDREMRIARNIDSEWINEEVIADGNNPWGAAISPNGRWLAYVSGETGQAEIFVRPWPVVDSTKWQVSTGRGREPLWGPNSDELFYMQPITGALMSVPVTNTTDNAPTFGNPTVLFTGYSVNASDPPSYAISPDGEYFLMTKASVVSPPVETTTGQAVLTVVENWFEELNRLVPSNLQ